MKIVNSINNKDSRLIFITHKEYERITGHLEWKLIRKIIHLAPFILIKSKALLIRYLFTSIKKKGKAKVIVHWGVTLNKTIFHDREICDLHMTDTVSSERLNREKNSTLSISLLSKDFDGLHDFRLSPSHQAQKWDLITVSHNSRRKRIEDILLIIRKALNKSPKLTCLLVINTPSPDYRKNNQASSVRFLQMYKEIFTYKERNQIVLVRVSDELGLEGISPLFIRYLMGISNNFIFASVSEGSAKVVTEAYSSGCFIFARKGLAGGSYDNIPEDRIFLWDTIEQCAEAICIQTQRNKSPIEIPENQVSKENVEKLLCLLQKLKLIENPSNYELSEFEFANRWLPAHLGIPQGRVTADILGIRDWISIYRKVCLQNQ